MKKKVFRAHMILCIEGRLFLFLAIIGFVCMDIIGILYIIQEKSLQALLSCIIIYAITTSFFFIAIPFLWLKCFEKLIITDKYVIWKCLFMKSHKLALKDIKYANILAFKNGNIVKIDPYHTSFLSVLLSSELLPSVRIDKIHCSNTLIKFQCSKKLCQTLSNRISSPQNRIFQIRVDQYEFEEQKRRKQKLKHKDRKKK